MLFSWLCVANGLTKVTEDMLRNDIDIEDERKAERERIRPTKASTKAAFLAQAHQG